MPGFLSHYIAGQAVLNSSQSHIQDIIKQAEKLYNIGAQGPDIFFYYLPGIIRKRSRDIGGQMHKNDLGLFIARLAHMAKKSNNQTVFAYTAGLIMHYVMDVHAHPYVYASVYNKNSSSIKNSADHRVFETAIDIALLKLVSDKKPADYSQWELINAPKTDMHTAAKAISQALEKVYDRNLPAKDISHAMGHMVVLTRILRSRKGRRKKWAALVENLTIKEPLFSSMVHSQSATDKDYLNQNHSPWQAPWDTAEVCTDSFLDRYHAAVEEGLALIEDLYQYVYGDMSLQALGQKLGNRSLQTGAPCGQKLW